ncbi:MAG: tetratricopeptide repeat protein [Myxococcota bacterium]
MAGDDRTRSAEVIGSPSATMEHPMVALGGRPEPVAADEVALRARKAKVFGSLFRMPAVRRFDRYVVLDTLGQGGMGTVLKVYDEQLDRAVAIKLLRRERSEGEVDRLRREAQALAKLSHPHVVQVYEVGRAEGQTFIAMELVKGQTLAQWAQQEPRPSWRKAVEVYRQAGAGLAAAHAKGIVHRDFKPGNAVIDDQGRVRVLDFGLARQSHDRTIESGDEIPTAKEITTADPRSSLTPSGTVLGTPGYMPPEQMHGHEVGAHSDQFSFCVALWEAVYAERPFVGRSLRALIGAIESGAIRPAPRGTAVSSKLRAVLLRGLAADPQQRWPSMEALLTALQSLVAPRGRRFIGLGLFGGLVAVGAGLGVSSVLDRIDRCTGARAQLVGIWDDARRQEVEDAIVGTKLGYAPDVWERAVQPALDDYADAWVAQHEDACEATSVRHEQSAEVMDRRMACLYRAKRALSAAVGVLARADAGVVANAHEVTGGLRPLSRCADVEALAAEVEPPLPAQTLAVDGVREILARAKAERDAGRYAGARAMVEDAKQRLAEVEYGPVHTEAFLEEGEVLHQQGHYVASHQALRQALGQALRWRQWDEVQRAASAMMFVVGVRQERAPDGLRYRELAMELAVDGSEAEVESSNNLARILRVQGRYEDAEREHRRALALHDELPRPDLPRGARLRGDLANVLTAQGRYAEAEQEHRRALAILHEALGASHPNVAISRNDLAAVLMAQGKQQEAEQELRRALVRLDRALGPDNALVASAHSNLANVLHAQGRYQEAEQESRRALETRHKVLEPGHPQVAVSRSNLALALMGQGKVEQAEQELRRAIVLWDETLGPEHPHVSTARNNLATILVEQRRYHEAEQVHRRVLASREKTLGSDHPYVAASRSNLAEVLLELGRADQARPLAENAWHRHRRGDVPIEGRASTAFVLARALWTDRAQRHRARELAQLARDGFAEHGQGSEDDLAQVEQWLDEHHVDSPRSRTTNHEVTQQARRVTGSP